MKPNKLHHGDTIGVFSSSSPTNADAMENLTRYFKQRDFHIKFAPNTLQQHGYMAGLPEKRASDLNGLVRDPDVKLLLTATGGAAAIQMLPLIDYDAFATTPKILVGLSDPTCILNAITARTKVPTFHGANGYNFGHKSPTPFTEDNWWRIVTGDFSIPYSYPLSQTIRLLKPGHAATGVLVGGNLRNLVYLVGTRFFPQFEGTILFLEEIGMPLHEIDAQLQHLKLAGVFENVRGLIMGQLVGCDETDHKNSETLDEILLRTFGEFDFPIFTNVPLGHTADKIMLPIGCMVSVNPTTLLVELVEDPFA